MRCARPSSRSRRYFHGHGRRHRLAVQELEEKLLLIFHPPVVLHAHQQSRRVVMLGAHCKEFVDVRLPVGNRHHPGVGEIGSELLGNLKALEPAHALLLFDRLGIALLGIAKFGLIAKVSSQG